jgi:UDP-glucose 6-dehydrogenase
MKISVIGAGYVGLTTAACLAQVGHDVFCSESDCKPGCHASIPKGPIL